MVCAGCGEPLTTGAGRGRPARYHNATCRQRARRARLATDHQAALATLTMLESATRDLRHALLTNGDTVRAHGRITRAVTDLAQHLNGGPDAPVPSPNADRPVTKPVTITRAASRPRSTPTSNSPVVLPSQNATTRGPNSIMAGSVCTPVVVKTVDLGEQVGPGWTLVQYDRDADASLWHVQQEGRTVGTVRRAYDLTTNARGWEARTAAYDHVRAVGTFAASRRDDRLWRTRNSAAAGLAARTDATRRTTRRARR